MPLLSISEDLAGEGLGRIAGETRRNVTGISLLSPEPDDKRQDIPGSTPAPGIRRMAALADSAITLKRHMQQQQEVARARGVEPRSLPPPSRKKSRPRLIEAKARGAESSTFWRDAAATPQPAVFIFDRIAATRIPAILPMAGYGGRRRAHRLRPALYASLPTAARAGYNVRCAAPNP